MGLHSVLEGAVSLRVVCEGGAMGTGGQHCIAMQRIISEAYSANASDLLQHAFSHAELLAWLEWFP